jgi:hypothetical protein
LIVGEVTQAFFTSYDLSKDSHAGAYLTVSAFIVNQASQDFVSDALLLLR